MKGAWTLGVCLSLGWLALPGAADEGPGQPPRPFPAAVAEAAAGPAPAGAVALGRPVPAEGAVERRTIADSQLRLVSCPPQPIATTTSRPRSQPPTTEVPAPFPAAAVPGGRGDELPPPDPQLARPVGLEVPEPPALVVARAGSEFAADRVAPAPVRVAASTEAVQAEVPAPGPESGSVLGGPCCEPGGPDNSSLYFRGEYLLWWFKGMQVPPLVTTSPASSFGILGAPGTSVLFGNATLDGLDHSGGRFTLGLRCDPCKPCAFETTYFFLTPRSNLFTATSDMTPVLARPFFNLNLGREDSEATAFPGLSTGSIAVATTSQLWGLEENLRCNLCCDCCYNVDLLLGARYVDLSENLSILESLQVLQNVPNTPAVAGSRVLVFDSFGTRNQFVGSQIGLDAEYHKGPCFVGLRLKVALGDVHEVVNINGVQVITTPTGATTLFRGGLLALPSNIGRFSRDRFAVLPDLNVNVGYEVTGHLRAFVGYNLL